MTNAFTAKPRVDWVKELARNDKNRLHQSHQLFLTLAPTSNFFKSPEATYAKQRKKQSHQGLAIYGWQRWGRETGHSHNPWQKRLQQELISQSKHANPPGGWSPIRFYLIVGCCLNFIYLDLPECDFQISIKRGHLARLSQPHGLQLGLCRRLWVRNGFVNDSAQQGQEGCKHYSILRKMSTTRRTHPRPKVPK